jgi:hypothetical protein
MNEIKNALNAGKEVITHTDAVSVPGWTGAGYYITDPIIGDGAYKIAGGGNGGFIYNDFWSRYLQFVSLYGISLDLTSAVGFLLFGSIPKSWVDASPLLGSKNPLTSVIRGLFESPLSKSIVMRAYIIPAFTLGGTFIGVFNVTILIEGFFYAI